jgi:anti-anti-sigma regulatory factor
MGSAEQEPFAAERSVLADGSVRVGVSGAVDTRTSCELLDCLVTGIVPGGRLTVDLRAAVLVDETGPAALALADRLAGLHGGELRVVGCSTETRRLLIDATVPEPPPE